MGGVDSRAFRQEVQWPRQVQVQERTEDDLVAGRYDRSGLGGTCGDHAKQEHLQDDHPQHGAGYGEERGCSGWVRHGRTHRHLLTAVRGPLRQRPPDEVQHQEEDDDVGSCTITATLGCWLTAAAMVHMRRSARG